LGYIVTLFATPTANLGTNGGSQPPAKRKAGGHTPNLQDEVEHLAPAAGQLEQPSLLFPTPLASDGRHGSANARSSRGDQTMSSAAASLLPTPRASDTGTAGRRAGAGVRPPLSQVVLPLWEREEDDPEGSRSRPSAGAPTCRRSDGGKRSPARLRHRPTTAAVCHQPSSNG